VSPNSIYNLFIIINNFSEKGTLAISRSIGDFHLKYRNLIIADPEITILTFKDFK
jgi:hypothetical protein